MTSTGPGRHLGRRALAVVVLGHSLLHLIGPLSTAGGTVSLTRVPTAAGSALWIAGALTTAVAAVQLWFGLRWYWVSALVAAVVSQGAIATDWSDAAPGSVVNLVLVGCAVHGFASMGPQSFSSRFRGAELALCSRAGTGRILGEEDLTHLPSAVATYIRRSGAVGRPVPIGFSAVLRGRIRSTASGVWMPFAARQVNCYSGTPSRHFHLDARQRGIPVDVFHEYVDGRATMEVRVLSLLPIVSAHGARMDRAETVTLFNDLCLFAPALLATSELSFEELDANTVEATWTSGQNTISAVLSFDAAGDLRDFVSDDRFRASADGRSFGKERWSTPVRSYREGKGSRTLAEGTAAWGDEGDPERFDYIELSVTDHASR